MSVSNPVALDFLLTRRSHPVKTLDLPVPDTAELTTLLTAAARCPDHGKLEPWRFIVLQKPALERLADLAEARVLINAFAALVTASAPDLGSMHAAPLRDGLTAVQRAFREASSIPDPPGEGPGERWTGPIT